MLPTHPLRTISAAPRSHLFTRFTKTTTSTTRSLSTTQHRLEPKTPINSSPFQHTASPLRLPKEEQEIFETLQRQSTGAFSTPRSPPQINQSPDSSASDRAEADSTITARTNAMAGEAQAKSTFQEDFKKVIEARGKGEELHPNVRRGAEPEFEGEVNPKTGEVGGPKNEPLRWGAAGEWSYNGRTTDF